MTPKPIGIYIHVPYCSFLCHYCDFAKTANWSQANAQAYFEGIRLHLKTTLDWLESRADLELVSVNFGGGTPSLFSHEYAGLLSLLPRKESLEISLEANPKDLTELACQSWKDLGFNRLSVGVQTFEDKGLKFLKRDHSGQEALRGLRTARKFFDNLNLDLIYGWQHQTLSMWQEDLRLALSVNPDHLSLYNLTFASTTPLGRAQARGKVAEQSDEFLVQVYEYSREVLVQEGYEQDEVSNWSRPHKTCVHNWLYWRSNYFVGLGPGAFGFLPAEDHALGIRYQMPVHDRSFAKLPVIQFSDLTDQGFVANHPTYLVESRNQEDWLTEFVGCALRTSDGVSLDRIQQVTGHRFEATEFLKEALKRGLISIVEDRLTLSPSEWFRETSWCLKVLDGFRTKSP